jgi:hypothetical protein
MASSALPTTNLRCTRCKHALGVSSTSLGEGMHHLMALLQTHPLPNSSSNLPETVNATPTDAPSNPTNRNPMDQSFVLIPNEQEYNKTKSNSSMETISENPDTPLLSSLSKQIDGVAISSSKSNLVSNGQGPKPPSTVPPRLCRLIHLNIPTI